MAELNNDLEKATAEKMNKGVTFKCIKKCFFNEQVYNEGDTLTVANVKAKEVPEHFEKVN